MSDNQRLFPLEDCGDFRAGRCADGTQALFGLWYGRVVACFFSPTGDFLRYEERDAPPPDTRDGAIAAAETWWAETGFVPGAIAVKELFYEPQGLAVHDGLNQFDPDEYSDWEKEEPDFWDDLEARKRGWIEDGLFLLFWDRDYYMSPEGRVHST